MTNSELAIKFHERFKGLDRAHGVYILGEKNKAKHGKIEGKARTVPSPPTSYEWELHLRGTHGLGIIPITDDATCYWGAIDIDVYKDFDLIGLEDEITRLKLPLILCRTKSGGAHLYLFLSEPVEAGIVRAKLMEWGIALGYANVEIFPKQVRLAGKEDYGNWLNMPYFEAAKTFRYALKKGQKLSAEEFLAYAQERQITYDKLESIKLDSNEELAEAPPCLQQLCSRGFPNGTRNSGLFNLAVFAKQKYPDDWRDRVENFNRQYMQPPLSSAEIIKVTQSVDKKKYFYTCHDVPISTVCNKQICLTRKYGVGKGGDDMGVVINGLTKINTTPPTWIVAINGIRITLEDTGELLNQSEFRAICAEKIDIFPKRIKPLSWDKLIETLLAHVEKIDAPIDASPSGQLLALVEEFCTKRAKADDASEILAGKPYEEHGFVYFRSGDLLQFFEQRRFKDITKVQRVWNILRDHGAVSKVYNVKGAAVRVWGMPAYKGQLELFDIPDVKTKEEF